MKEFIVQRTIFCYIFNGYLQPGKSNMYIVDDPMLALITRFRGEDAQNLEISDEEFLLRQIAIVKNHVRQFPDSERSARAMEWIATHARQYRRQWQRHAVAKTLLKARCPDCPLAGEQRSSCEIHAFWLKLLQQYIADDLSAQEYVENALKLLGRYKNRLKIGLIRERPSLGTAQIDPA